MAAITIIQNKNTPFGSIVLGDGAKGISIQSAYLGNILVFSGQRWLWCLVDSDEYFLETSDGYKIQPKMEA